MQGIKSLTKGPINRQLFNLAIPIMATSFIQMAYSLTDMAWVGRLGSEAVAAVGAVGILTWMSGSIALLNKVGSEVSVGQSIGARSEQDARQFAWRTNRSHHLEYLARFLHRIEYFHCTKLCCRREIEGEESLAHNAMDDVYIRYTLFIVIHILRKRSVLYLCARTGSIPCGWRLPAYRRLFTTLHDAGNHYARGFLRIGKNGSSCHHQHIMQLHAYPYCLIPRTFGNGCGRYLVGCKCNNHCQGNHPHTVVYYYKKKNSLKKTNK